MFEGIDRRDFLKTAAAGAVGALASSPLATAATESWRDIRNYNPAMRYRRLGKTGVMISEASFGGHWRTRTGRRYWGRFKADKIPPDVLRNREDVFGRAIDLGVNYLDITTPAEAQIYGEVMKRLGQRMWVGYSDYILCIRNPKNRTEERIMFEIDEGLRRLQVDCIDIFRPQARTDGKHTDKEIETVVKTFEKAKKQGKVRHLGMSTHNREFVIHVIEMFPEFEMFLFPYPAGADMDPDHSVFPLAKKNDVGIVTIKPFAGGSLFRSKHTSEETRAQIATLGIRRILANKYITAFVGGTTTVAELENNVRAPQEPLRLSEREEQWLQKHVRHAMANLPPDYAWLREWQRV